MSGACARAVAVIGAGLRFSRATLPVRRPASVRGPSTRWSSGSLRVGRSLDHDRRLAQLGSLDAHGKPATPSDGVRVPPLATPGRQCAGPRERLAGGRRAPSPTQAAELPRVAPLRLLLMRRHPMSRREELGLASAEVRHAGEAAAHTCALTAHPHRSGGGRRRRASSSRPPAHRGGT